MTAATTLRRAAVSLREPSQAQERRRNLPAGHRKPGRGAVTLRRDIVSLRESSLILLWRTAAPPQRGGATQILSACPMADSGSPLSASANAFWISARPARCASRCSGSPCRRISTTRSSRSTPVALPAISPGRFPISVAVERVARESFLRRPDERVAAHTGGGYPHRPPLRFVRAPLGPRRRSDPPTGFVVHLLASTFESSPISSSGVHRIGAS